MKRSSMPPRKRPMDRGKIAGEQPRQPKIIRALPPGEPVPLKAPRRYLDGRGYVRLRWRVAPGEYVEEYEHRIVMGRPGGDVHHRNGDKADNRPENLQVLDKQEHTRVHEELKRDLDPLRGTRGHRSKGIGRRNPGARARVAGEKAERARKRQQERTRVAQAMRDDYEAGMTLHEVAAKYGVHHTSVLRRIRKAGARVRPPRREGRTFDADLAVDMYSSGVGVARVARQFGVSVQRVLAAVDAAGIPRKAAGRPKGTTSAEERRAREVVYGRSGGICECCGAVRASEWHHRKNRSQRGRWSASNGLHLCPGCHRWVTEHPAEAYARGWMVRSTATPAEIPVELHDGLVYLDDDGNYVEGSP